VFGGGGGGGGDVHNASLRIMRLLQLSLMYNKYLPNLNMPKICHFMSQIIRRTTTIRQKYTE